MPRFLPLLAMLKDISQRGARFRHGMCARKPEHQEVGPERISLRGSTSFTTISNSDCEDSGVKCSGLLLRADAAHLHKVKLISTLRVALDTAVVLLGGSGRRGGSKQHDASVQRRSSASAALIENEGLPAAFAAHVARGCGCHAGYQQGPGLGECRANGVAAWLIFSTSEDIRSIGVGNEENRDLTMRTAGPSAMATCVGTHTLYWAPHAQGSIYRVSMDASPEDPILVLKGQGSVSGLAVDWLHWRLYWSDQHKGSVNVSPLDGSAPRLLIGGLEQPTAIAVEPFLGLLFWAESGIFPKISRAGLDGQDVVTLVTSSIRNPVAISLDVPRQLLYWADRDTRTISRVDLAGRHRKTVLKSNGYMDQLSGLAVFEGQLYWSDGGSRSICNGDKHNGSTFRVLMQTPTPPGGLVLIHPLLQPTEMAIPQSPPVHVLPDATFAGILSLIVFLGALLVGVVTWWWREQSTPGLHLQTISLKESQDPLLHRAPLAPHTGTETLFKVELDTD
ncbi:Very low-density lipoprotein receptor [Merluccius polli]|uniref:Very low-density lipoprotein receptor n=1 Tax=Merluccius polli TaxID=89951 RepID=A0AA47MQ53_MERPO|nr:Very low-density lipoprotein receptor [Merluccius polli]